MIPMLCWIYSHRVVYTFEVGNDPRMAVTITDGDRLTIEDVADRFGAITPVREVCDRCGRKFWTGRRPSEARKQDRHASRVPAPSETPDSPAAADLAAVPGCVPRWVDGMWCYRDPSWAQVEHQCSVDPFKHRRQLCVCYCGSVR